MSAVHASLLGWLALLVCACETAAQPARPAPPEKQKVLLRYQIVAPRDLHVVLYDALIEHLKDLEFNFNPPLDTRPDTDREDPTKNRLEGIVPTRNLLKILRNPNVASLLVLPEKYKAPDDANEAVRVRLELASGFQATAQRELARQARVLLQGLGFREAVAYDDRGYFGRPHSRLVGTIPAGQLDNMPKDLRGQPGGWLAPALALGDLPTPLRNTSPILITEVLSDWAATGPLKKPLALPVRDPAHLTKLSDELWELSQQKEKHGEIVRLQVILAAAPPANDKSWQEMLSEAAPGFLVEGQEGAIITGLTRLGHVSNLSSLAMVTTVREVRPVQPAVRADLKFPTDNKAILEKSGVGSLHRRGFKGKGVRLAIIDTDFRGWDDAVTRNKLPANTRLVDLTTEQNPDLYPAAFVGDVKEIGHGTRCAVASALAAPEAEIILIRILGTGPHELRQVAEFLRGTIRSRHLDRRQDELLVARSVLRLEREELLQDRDTILKDFRDRTDLEHDFGFLGPVYGWVFDARHWLYQRTEWHAKEELELRQRQGRFIKFHETLTRLQGIPIVACTAGWNTGYPQGSGSALSRWLDDPAQAPLWFQAAGNTRGQSWNDEFRDADGDGVMEFAAPQMPLPKDRWTGELNFLAWQPYQEPQSPDLPEKLRLRISLQWLEPHDPDYFVRFGDPDFYRKPLAEMRLVLLRQRDPEGKAVSADDFDIVSRTAGLPQRLDNQPAYSVYEQTLDIVLEKSGRYALRLEKQLPSQWTLAVDPVTERLVMTQVSGLSPTGLRPLGVATLPGLEKWWELRPRLFIQAADSHFRLRGRPVFADFMTDAGAIGAPADARGVISVGAADLKGRAQPYSASGPPADVRLVTKPDVLTYDALDADGTGTAYGTHIAAPFAAGAAAAALSSGRSPEAILQFLRANRGSVLRLP